LEENYCIALNPVSRGISVCIVNEIYGLDDRVSIPDRGKDYFLFAIAFTPAPRSTQTPVE